MLLLSSNVHALSLRMLKIAFLHFNYRLKLAHIFYQHVKRNCHNFASPNRDISDVKKIKGVLLDITGVLYESGKKHAINGSVEAIQKLRSCNIPFKFVTNESTSTSSALTKKLQSFGFQLSEEEIFSPGSAASLYIQEHKLKPYLLVHTDILPEFSNCDQSSPNCVVVGDAGDNFSYKNMNNAFTVLMKSENPILISMGKGKYYREQDELVMDLGGFTAALEYATGVTAKIIGKPSSDYFYSASETLKLKPEEIAMVGDDIHSDVGASQKCGFYGVLVKTGKFRQKDLDAGVVKPDAVVDNLAHFVDMIC